MRYRLPEGCAGVVHAGVILEAAADGTIELDEATAAALAPHGLVLLGEEPSRVPRPKNRLDDRRMLR